MGSNLQAGCPDQVGTTGLGPPEHQSDHHDHHEDGDHNHDHHDDVLKYDDGDNLGFCRLTTNLIIMRMMVLIMEIMMIMAMLATKRK